MASAETLIHRLQERHGWLLRAQRAEPVLAYTRPDLERSGGSAGRVYRRHVPRLL